MPTGFPFENRVTDLWEVVESEDDDVMGFLAAEDDIDINLDAIFDQVQFEEVDDEVEGLTDEEIALREAIADVVDCQCELHYLTEQADVEVIQVQEQFEKAREQVFERRGKVIEKLPGFWLDVILHHPDLKPLLDGDDEFCLYFLKKFEVDKTDEGYRLKFEFSEENPYFDDVQLVKEVIMEKKQGRSREERLSTEIKWKPGQDLTKQKEGVNKDKIERGEATFFTWFNDNNKPPGEDEIAEIFYEIWSNPGPYIKAANRTLADDPEF